MSWKYSSASSFLVDLWKFVTVEHIGQTLLQRKMQQFPWQWQEMDHALALNRPAIRTKKWWFPLLQFMLQTSMHNSYILYKRKRACSIKFMDFLKVVVQSTLVSLGKSSKPSVKQFVMAMTQVRSRVSDSVRASWWNWTFTYTKGNSNKMWIMWLRSNIWVCEVSHSIVSKMLQSFPFSSVILYVNCRIRIE